jgi:DnaJ family protein C protein 2
MTTKLLLLPSVPATLLAFIVQQKTSKQDEDESAIYNPTIDLVPLRVDPVGYGYFHYSKEPMEILPISTSSDESNFVSDKISAHQTASGLSALDLAIGENYYHILGFPKNVNPHTVTHLQIKKAYKKAALMWHPDKLPNKDDTMFKKVNRAWEVLGTSRISKIQYDSSLPFDDSIPDYDESMDKDDETYSQFFKRFQEAFDRWSNLATCHKNMIPKLGDINSTKEHVDNFYKFWSHSFKSWRDFGYLNEYDEKNADSREERRWMQRQNAKKNLIHKKEEREKLKALIATCRKNDPRVKKFIREENELRERLRLKKEQEALERERIRLQKLEEERLEQERLERERAEEKKRKQAEKQRQLSELQSLQKQFRQMCYPHVAAIKPESVSITQKGNVIRAEDIEFVITRLKNVEQLRNVISKLNELPQENFVSNFDKCVKALRKKEEEEMKERQQQLESLNAKQRQEQSEKEWTQEELVLLTKAIVKFPGGTIDRWKHVAEFIGTRTPDEVQKMTGDIRKGKINAAKMISQKKKEVTPTDNKDQVIAPKEWTKEEQKHFEDALRKHKALKGDEKWQAVASELKNRTIQECKDRFEWCKEMAKKKAAAAASK